MLYTYKADIRTVSVSIYRNTTVKLSKVGAVTVYMHKLTHPVNKLASRKYAS